MKVSVVISADGSFCCNYATDLRCIYGNYANDNVCCILAGFHMLLSVYWYVGESFCNNYASDCFCCSYAVRGFCSTYAGDSFCSKYMGDNFYCNYVDGCLCCNYAGGIFCSAFMHDCVYCNYVGDFPLQLCRSQFQVTISYSFL